MSTHRPFNNDHIPLLHGLHIPFCTVCIPFCAIHVQETKQGIVLVCREEVPERDMYHDKHNLKDKCRCWIYCLSHQKMIQSHAH